MVDVDYQSFIFELFVAIAYPEEIAAVDRKNGVERLCRYLVHEAFRSREELISIRHLVFEIDDAFLAERLEGKREGECRAYGVAIRVDMRGDHELFSLCNYLFNPLK